MKKLSAILLALAMAATLTVPAFAAEPTGGTSSGLSDSGSITVAGKYDGTAKAAEAPVVSADIAWDANEATFTYTKPDAGDWNEATHKYDNVVDGGWSDNKLPITISNHSDVYINVKLAFVEAQSHTEEIYGYFYSKSGERYTYLSDVGSKGFLLESGVGKAVAAPDSKVVYLGIDGGPITAGGKIGTVTVTISNVTQKVSTAEQLRAAVAEGGPGGSILLQNDIDLGDTKLTIYADTILDLGGHTLSIDSSYEAITNYNDYTVIQNGTVENKGTNSQSVAISTAYSSIALRNCTLKANGDVMRAFKEPASSGILTIKMYACKIETPSTTHWLWLYGRGTYTSAKYRLELSGDCEAGTGLQLPHAMSQGIGGVYIESHSSDAVPTSSYPNYVSIVAGAGCYLYFDPTAYVDEGLNVADNSGISNEWYVR